MDDTLYPERDFIRGGYRAVGVWTRRKWGVDISPDLAALFNRGLRGDLFTPALLAHDVRASELEVLALVEIYREHKPEIKPFPETRAVLERLRAQGLKLGVITDGYWQVQLRKWESLGLTGFFDAVVFSDEFGREYWKPHQRPYREIARRLHVSVECAAYVGDNPAKDFAGARSSGMPTVRIRRPGGLHSGVSLDVAQEADTECADLNCVVEWINGQY